MRGHKRQKTTSSHVKVYTGSIASSGRVPALSSKKMNMTQVTKARTLLEAARKAEEPRLNALVRQKIAEAALESGQMPADMHFTAPQAMDIDYTEQDETGGEGEGEGDDGWVSVDEADDEDGPEGRGASSEDAALHKARLQAVVSLYGGRMRSHRDHRTRAHRRAAVDREWRALAPGLLDAYMSWKYGDGKVSKDSDDLLQAHQFTVQVLGLAEHDPVRSVTQRLNEEANISLVRSGLLGGSPYLPSLAFTLDLLEFYHQLRRRHPSVGIQGFAKTVCVVNGISYFPALQEKLSRAFDVYLDMLRRLERYMNEALGRDKSNWRLFHGCPCCGFKQPDEPELVPARLQVMDGCSSQKRLRGAGHNDVRTFDSSYFISPHEVDRFAGEVKRRSGRSGTAAQHKDTCEDALPTDGRHRRTKCGDNWQAANATAMGKSVTEVFEQTGVFLCACRHGVVEFVEEMVRSGELAKYPLAIIDVIMRNFGDDQGVGYDIGCHMDATVRMTSLAPAASATRLQLIVNSFHGYAHNRPCQLEYHPLYRPGLGIEDLETCERVFSSLNGVARTIRHASYFHWLQFIELHLKQWDQERYGELSRFIYNNYRQSQSMIVELEPEVALFQKVTGYTGEDFENWHREEAQYLAKLEDEPVEDLQRVAYVEALESLSMAFQVYKRITTVEFTTYTAEHFGPDVQPKALQTALLQGKESERRAAQRKLELAMNVADDLERRLGITERWTPSSPEYAQTIEFMRHRKFTRAVEELEGLVVQRLFELAKANVSGISYKLRKHISQAITRRSAAVRTSLDNYNELAPLQKLPRPVLHYNDVAEYAWLGDFDILKESRSDILDKPWAKPANREAAIKYFKVKRAREEIVRLNVETPRLQAWVDFEDQELEERVQQVTTSDPLLAKHIASLAMQRRAVNDRHRARLAQIYALPGYSGPVYCGVDTETPSRTPSSPAAALARHTTVWALDRAEGPLEPEDLDVDEDDELNDEVIRLGDVLQTVMVG